MDPNSSDLDPGSHVEPELSIAAVDGGGSADASILLLPGLDAEEPPQFQPQACAPILVDWDTLHIEDPRDDEGRIEVMSEEQLYALLGLRDEDDMEKRKDDDKARKAEDEKIRRERRASAKKGPVNIDTSGAAIPVDDFIPEERVIVYDKDNPCMDLGTMYPSMKEFRLAVRQYAINKEFELHIVATDPTRYIGNCKTEGCPWHIVGRRQVDFKTIMVTVLIDEHTCYSSSRRKTTTPTCSWVASKAIPILRKFPKMTPVELQAKLQDMYKCEIKYDTVWRGKQVALGELHGTWDESFQQLYNWREEVLRRSPGSVIEIETMEVDGKIYFHRFFCALSPCIEGFLGGCRPYLSIDSTALNGRWNGQLASATALDGHNWMYPVAFGFIQSETEDNWAWFMRCLHRAIGDLPRLAICTDACKGLENAVAQVFPYAEQRECFRHLMQNFIKKFTGDIFSHMYPAARAYREGKFKWHMTQIISASNESCEWLLKNHSLKWMRCAFNPDIKCDYITNNLAEVFNNWVKDYKDLPVTELIDKIREMIMTLWEKRRKIGERLEGKILPAVLRQLKARTRGLGHLTVVKSDQHSAEIWDTSQEHHARHVVKAYLHDCTCLEWQHTGKPCQHALALVTSQQNRDVKLEDFVHEYYSVDKFREAYSRLIEPLPDRSQWPDVDLPFQLGAPIGKRNVGRQKKLRYKSALEGGSSSKAKKDDQEKKKTMIRGKRRCNRCGELGHTEVSYKCPLNGTKKRKRKPRKNTTKQKKATVEVSTPNRPISTRETIIQESPGATLTRRRLALMLGEGTSSQHTDSTPTQQATPTKKSTPKKITPRRKRQA
ncbi:unnamed protein product [Urochloa humidicola]